MEAQILDWFTFVLRWFHVITAIAWIGASFYFIWLDLSLEPPSEEKSQAGIGGGLWAIHGGGIYEVGKYRSHPTPMPKVLHWFKWEAYSTWLSGSALLIVIYYFKADAYLVGANLWATTAQGAILMSVGYLLGGLALYELFMRYVVKETLGQAVVVLVLVTVLSYVAFQTFAPRAAILHVGAVLATMMAANVFLIIIPSQKAFVGAIERGEEADIELSLNAKKRSTHNNYLTLPVLFCMLSNHGAFIYGHPQAWLFVVAFSCVAAFARHYFNAKHAGRHHPWILVVAGILFVVLVGLSMATSPSNVQSEVGVSDEQAQIIVTSHCTGCHTDQPTLMGFTAPPGGMVFDQPDQLFLHRQKVLDSLQTQFMPLGNITGMTAEERTQLIAYLNQ
ncbi:MAG: urate hydroxylase PuuD [Pseudomonadota bacterium]